VRFKCIIAGVLALLLAACASFYPRQTGCVSAVVLRRFPSSEELGRYPLAKDGRFSLSFIHSVSTTPVRDNYRVEGDTIIQTSETFEAHGAGLPSMFGEPGATDWEQRDGKFILHMQRPIDRLIVRTDRRYHNRLHLHDTEIDLNQWEDQALEVIIEPSQVQYVPK